MSIKDIDAAFALSRVDAGLEANGYQVRCDRACASGAGLQIAVVSDGQALRFWVAEGDWYQWLTPQLAVCRFMEIEEELRPVLAAWTLNELNDLLSNQGLPDCKDAQLSRSAAVDGECWRLTFSREDGRRLPLYCQNVTDDWLQAVLRVLSATAEREYALRLVMGWCFATRDEWQRVQVGDALPLYGGSDRGDCFWLQHAQAILGRVQYAAADQALLVDAGCGANQRRAQMLGLAVEVGKSHVAAPTLAQWCKGQTLTLPVTGFPVLRLTQNGALRALGQLLHFDNGWLVRIISR